MVSSKTEDYKHLSHSHLSFKGEHATISGIGLIHGLASNDELLLLVVLGFGLSSYWQMFIALTIFTIGVTLGMILFGTVIKLSFSQLVKQEKVIKLINLIIAGVTIGYGIFTLVGGEGLNLTPFISEEFQAYFLIAAFILGLKHSMDVDHVVAISSVLLRASSIKKTITLSISWALGHMVTAGIITFILYLSKTYIILNFLSHFESLVSIMLILIGVLTIAWETNLITFGKHSHGHIHENGFIHDHSKGEQTHIHEENME